MLSPVDLLQFFRKNKGIFINRNNIRFEMITEDYFKVSTPAPITSVNGIIFPIRIEMKFFGLYDLVNTLHIYSLHTLKNKIDFGTLYGLYYSIGKGQMIVTITGYLQCSPLHPVEIHVDYHPEEIDRVKISIPFLNFFEVVEEGFYDIEQYNEYVQRNSHLFNWLLKNKSNMMFSKNLGADEYQN